MLNESLFVLEINNKLIGCLVISNNMDHFYKKVKWLTPNHNNIYLHRLAVDPSYQKKGYAKQLMTGFKRLISEGFNAKSNHYGYAQTSTGPGHTTVATGTHPAVHGIIGNSWFDKKTKKSVYCVDDSNYSTVGSSTDQGKKSPSNLLTGDKIYRNTGDFMFIDKTDDSGILGWCC